METKVISVCKRTRRSFWPGAEGSKDKKRRNTDAGMKMVVVHEKGARGKLTSKTMFVAA